MFIALTTKNSRQGSLLWFTASAHEKMCACQAKKKRREKSKKEEEEKEEEEEEEEEEEKQGEDRE